MRGGTFRDRTDLWNSVLEFPTPRILVLQDMDNPAGRGAFIGDVHASILKALSCIAYVTNGAVRELPAVRHTGVHMLTWVPRSLSADWRSNRETCCMGIVTAL